MKYSVQSPRGAGLTECRSAEHKGARSLPRSRVALLFSCQGASGEGVNLPSTLLIYQDLLQ